MKYVVTTYPEGVPEDAEFVGIVNITENEKVENFVNSIKRIVGDKAEVQNRGFSRTGNLSILVGGWFNYLFIGMNR